MKRIQLKKKKFKEKNERKYWRRRSIWNVLFKCWNCRDINTSIKWNEGILNILHASTQSNSIIKKGRKKLFHFRNRFDKARRERTFFHSLIQRLFPCVHCSPNPFHIHRQSASNNTLRAITGTKREYSFAAISEAGRWSNLKCLFFHFPLKKFVLSVCRFFRCHLFYHKCRRKKWRIAA